MINKCKYYWCVQSKRWTTTNGTKDHTDKQIPDDKKLTTSTLPSETIVPSANTVVTDTFSLTSNSVDPKSAPTSASTNLTTYDLSTLRNILLLSSRPNFKDFRNDFLVAGGT